MSRSVVVVLSALALMVGACAEEEEELTPVSLQLEWVVQAEFAGYYAAVDQGFYVG